MRTALVATQWSGYAHWAVKRYLRGVGLGILGASLGCGVTGCNSRPKDEETTPSVERRPRRPPPPQTPASANAAPSASASATAAAPAPTEYAIEVNLVDPGNSPRRPIRFDVQPAEVFRWVSESSGSMKYEGLDFPEHPLPHPRWTFEMKADEVPDNGVIKTQVSITEALSLAEALPPALAAAARQETEVANRFAGTQTLTLWGLATPTDRTLPPEMDSTTQRLLDKVQNHAAQSLVPFPEEPLGVGARWTVVRRYPVMGARVRELTVYELLSMDDQGVKFDGLITASAPPSPLNMDRPDGRELHLVRVSLLGKVEGQARFDHPVPTTTSTGTMKMSVKLRDGDQVLGEGTLLIDAKHETRPTPVPTAPTGAPTPPSSSPASPKPAE